MSQHSLKKLQELIDKVHIDSEFYIDRIDIMIYDLSFYKPCERFINHERKRNRLRLKTANILTKTDQLIRTANKYNGCDPLCICFVLSLTQPNKQLIQDISRLLTGSHYNISWIEVAFDIKTTSQQNALELMHLLSKYLVFPGCSKPPSISEANDGNKKKRDSIWYGDMNTKCMFKMYLPQDDENKPFGVNCLHTEVLIRDAQKLRQTGIWDLEDLLLMNLSAWYQHQVKLYGINMKEIGALLVQKIKPGSTPTDETCRNHFKKKFSHIPQLSHHIYHHKNKALRKGLRLYSGNWLP